MKKLCFLLALALLPLLSQAQKLEGMKNEVKSGNSGGGNSNNNDGGGWSNNNDGFWLELFFNIALEPTWWLLFRAPGELPANYVGFNDYPYADDENGLYLPPDFEPTKKMNLQLTGHVQTDEDAVFGGYLQAKWSPSRALTLDVNRLQLFETLEDAATGDVIGTDHFAITNINLAYNRVHHSKFQLWWGGGLMLLGIGKDELLYGSPSLNAGFTWYFKKPLSFHAETQLGYPNDVFARQHQVRMQFHLKQYMVYAGYQGTSIGDERLPSLSIGTGIWF